MISAAMSVNRSNVQEIMEGELVSFTGDLDDILEAKLKALRALDTDAKQNSGKLNLF
jgi:hypothetical protein